MRRKVCAAKRIHLIAALVGFVALGVLAADVSAMYHPSMGRFLQRDPGAGSAMRIGAGGGGPLVGFMPMDQYVDGMNLYEYVGGNPTRGSTDPMGLWKIERKGQARATATAEKNDSILRLAVQASLFASEFPYWARGAVRTHGGGTTWYLHNWPRNWVTQEVIRTKICPGEKVTIPNVFVVAEGEVRGLISRPLVHWWAISMRRAVESAGFKVWYFRGSAPNKISSEAVQAKINGDVWGFAVFGHGERTGSLAGDILWSGSAVWGATDIMGPNVLWNRYKYGAGLRWGCHGQKNERQWRSLVSGNGLYYSTHGWVLATEGPRGINSQNGKLYTTGEITPTWDRFVRAMTYKEKRWSDSFGP